MYDVVIVGAGVMGSATAYWLSRAGKRVALLDTYSPAHVGAASADESRMVRYQYRGQTLYTEMVAAAVELWRAFDRRMGTSFYREQGALALQARPDYAPFIEGYEGLLELGYEPQWLNGADLRRRYPQFANVDSGYILEGLGGYVAAGPVTQALAEAAAELGADVRENAEVTELRESGGRLTSVVTRDGRTCSKPTCLSLRQDRGPRSYCPSCRSAFSPPPRGCTTSRPRTPTPIRSHVCRPSS